VSRGFFGSSISALALLSLAGSAAAHHPPRFDHCKLYTLEGDVQSVDWRNPHVKLSIKTAEGANYDLIWRSIQQLTLAGVQKDAVRVGDPQGRRRRPVVAAAARLLNALRSQRAKLRLQAASRGFAAWRDSMFSISAFVPMPHCDMARAASPIGTSISWTRSGVST
jgi:hypothetical protein